MRSTMVYLVIVYAWAVTVHGDEDNAPQRFSLWNGRAPVGIGTFEQADAWITVHRPSAEQAPRDHGTAIVICPGGGYGTLVLEPEGHGIAKWLNTHGITGIVLEYRLPAGRREVPLYDAQRAIRMTRLYAAKWKIDPHRVGIMGFSAGGHLAATAATQFDDGNLQAAAPVDRFGCRPDFAILVYPVITMDAQTHAGTRRNLLGPNPRDEWIALFSNEKQVTSRTCPTFLAHAADDEAVSPENSRAFYAALRAHGVSAKYLELPSGGHGLNGYQGPMWDAWQREALAWLAEHKFLPARTSDQARQQ